MVNISADLQFGMDMEDRVLTLLKEKVNKNIIQTPKYHSFDYLDASNNTFYELKTRRVKHDTYGDTMCGYCKLKFAKENTDNNYIFLFKFTDGLYYHKWDKYKHYDMRAGGRCDRGKVEISNYFYIKKEDLKKFENI